jgi:TonB family protein
VKTHVAVVLALIASTAAAQVGSRLTREEIADPLAPWTLEAVVARPVATAPGSSPMVPSDAPAETPPALEPERPPRGDEIPTVRCRQISLGSPDHARRLAALLQAGAALEDARRALGGVDLIERQRDYALEDLEPDLRAELESLPIGGWTRVRSWRGRSILVQVVSRAPRVRAALPALGEGLSDSERERLTTRFRLNAPPPPPPRGAERDDQAALQPAAVIEQAKPEPPAGLEQGGEVEVLVEVGREGEPVDVRVKYASNPLLEASALEAARRSRYRAATRLGIPEPGTVTLTFRYAAPGAPEEQSNE